MGWSVLLIEDNETEALAVTNWLESTGLFDVTTAYDGASGAQFAKYGEWDLVIADIQLPGLEGVDIAMLVKERDIVSPVILVTGHERMDYATRAVRSGADELLLKPLDAERLVSTATALVERALDRRVASTNRILAIGAHPDDVEIGIGGILLRHRSRGEVLHILTLTGGEEGGETGTRATESAAAAARLNGKLFMDSLKDTAISEGKETISSIERVIRDVNPQTIYTHTESDAHQDHRNVHRATLVAARGIPNLFCYQAPSTTVDFSPNRFVDVSPFMDEKLLLIGEYQSQTAIRPYLEHDLIQATARYWGRFAGYRMVEPLEVVRESE